MECSLATGPHHVQVASRGHTKCRQEHLFAFLVQPGPTWRPLERQPRLAVQTAMLALTHRILDRLHVPVVTVVCFKILLRHPVAYHVRLAHILSRPRHHVLVARRETIIVIQVHRAAQAAIQVRTLR